LRGEQVQQHFKVRRGTATLGYALYNNQGLFFTPAAKVPAKDLAEVWGALDSNKQLPEGVKLERWVPPAPLPTRTCWDE
jgi:hypothetical protein